MIHVERNKETKCICVKKKKKRERERGEIKKENKMQMLD